MVKAFLSHSSAEAELVRLAGTRVGRPFVSIDYFAFDSGDELLRSVTQAAADSALFVLFAGRPSLNSAWVREEIREAEYSRAFGRLQRVLVIATDDSTRASDLPPWLRRYKYAATRAPGPIARLIRSEVDELIRARQSTFFVGRARETTLLQDAIAPTDGSPPPKVIGLVGLAGIGRQTLARRVSADLLSFPRSLRIDVESGDAVQDIATKAAHLIEAFSTAGEANAITADIQASDGQTALRRLSDDLQAAAAQNEFIVLYDKGGVLDHTGRLTRTLVAVLDAVARLANVYVFVVLTRRPAQAASGTPGDISFPIVPVRPLAETDVRSLITLSANRAGITLGREQVTVLAEQVRGYPPAVTYAVELMRAYGAALILQQREQVVAFRSSPFIQYIRSLDTKPTERSLLRLLAANSPLPLEVLVAASRKGSDSVGEALMHLIDVSLAVPDDSGWYRIADPVADAVSRAMKSCSRDEYAAIAQALNEFIPRVQGEGSVLELERVRFRALVMSGKAGASRQAGALIADWIRLAESLYHERRYAIAAETGRAALEARPGNADAVRWLIRALIKLEEFEEARERIRTMSDQGEGREALYLSGFLERHRGKTRECVEFYQRALDAGYSGVAIHRELAQGYLDLNDLPQARTHIALAQERQRDNPYIIDLMIKIACAQRDETTARQLLTVLAGVDRPAFVAHRRSRVEDVFGSAEDAYRAAQEAVGDQERPPFEMLAQLTLCEIKTARYESASAHLDQMNELNPSQRRDIQTGLRCRMAISQGHYRTALDLWENLRTKERPVHLKLRRDALEGLLRETVVAADERLTLDKDVDNLNRRLSDFPDADFDFGLLGGD